MALAAGETLGAYEILSPLGAGGMGEVYKARDTRLDRTVAIKVLPSHLAGDAHLKERFEREARAVSSLNHPHICTLHDIGQHDGVDFLVLEYLAGESLAERLKKKGALPFDEALRFGAQIADALDKAHRQGVVHRDLKPANVMVTESGVKLLDFGLAKVALPEAGPVESALPTEQQRSLTAEGSILGTLQYMAPEQLEGQEADARTDVFALGAVLYEMVTGRRAFEGKSQASLIGAIMTAEPPPVSRAQAMSPPPLDHLVRVCLAKRPEDRWQSAADVARQLTWIAGEGVVSEATPPAGRRDRRWSPRDAVLGVLAGGLVAAAVTLHIPRARAPRAVTRLDLALGPTEVLSRPGRRMLAFSPDGRRIAYTANRQIYLREMEQFEAAPIRGTPDNPATPFFSPDGESIGFYAEGALRTLPIRGGTATALCEAENLFGASWAADGTIVFGQGPAGIWRVSANGGEPERLVTVEAGEVAYGPQILPGGDTLLFTLQSGDLADESAIVAQSLETGERRVLVEGGADARYAPSGHLVYAVGEALRAIRFDVGRLEVVGSPAPVLQAVRRSTATAAAQFSFSDDGSLVFLPPGEASRLKWLDRRGVARTSGTPAAGDYPRLSPDGRKLAVVIGGDIWVYDVGRGTSTRVTFTQDNIRPGWASDGEHMVFSSTRGGVSDLFWAPADGSGTAEPLSPGQLERHVDSVSPDGATVVFHEHHPSNGMDVWMLPLDGERQPRPVLQTPYNEDSAVVSPDGAWLAYHSDESGRGEIYVQRLPGPGGKIPISTDGGANPLWGPSGRELFYSSDDDLMVVDVETGPAFRAGPPRLLLEGFPTITGARQYDVAPDGDTFVVIDQTASTTMHVVLNWFDDLDRLLPAK